jgi:hypothetical protein
MKCAVEMGSDAMIYLPGFRKIGTGVQGILRFFFRNLNGCNVGLRNSRD